MDTMIINGKTYVEQQETTGNRHVVVLSSGWVFAGDITEEGGRVRLDNAVGVRNWRGIGFNGLVAEVDRGKVTLEPMTRPVDYPAGVELFRVPVSDSWGK